MGYVPVVDLFAGPGGLSYGFSSLEGEGVRFKVALSIEKDPVAFQTLFLRAFVRQFSALPDEYYDFIRSPSEAGLAALRERFPVQWGEAETEAKCWELGKHPFAQVSGAITAALKGAKDWVLLGGPPCQAYSLAGRSRMKRRADFGTDHRHTLYREYLKIVAAHGPAVFVMENVKGILSSRHGAKNKDGLIFDEILSDLRNPAVAMEGILQAISPLASHGYSIYSFTTEALTPDLLKPKDFLIKSEEWGIPQTRHRVILLGVRNDLARTPKTLANFFTKNSASIEQVIDTLPRIRSRLSKADDDFSWRYSLRTAATAAAKERGCPISSAALARRLTQSAYPKSTGAHFIRGKGRFKPRIYSSWLWDARLGGVIQHEARGHMPLDLARYFFCSCLASELGKSPTLAHFPKGLLPKHRNLKRRVGQGKRKRDFADRFRVQVRGLPATTITSHICKDGHYYIHYDYRQCRSLTVREAARIQTFPDSYYFFGGRTEQYHQVGNAVPPLLASKLAKVVADLIGPHDERQSKKSERKEAVIA